MTPTNSKLCYLLSRQLRALPIVLAGIFYTSALAINPLAVEHGRNALRLEEQSATTLGLQIANNASSKAQEAQFLVRVLLLEKVSKITIGSDGSIDALNAKGAKLGKFGNQVECTFVSGKVKIVGDRRELTEDYFILKPQENRLLTLKDKAYRGEFLLTSSSDGQLLVINILDIEDYLRGVVPAEMPASWHEEALKAQAVAARTYALAKALAPSNPLYDLRSGVEDQVYLGVRVENPKTDIAISATRGLVVTYENAPIVAYYHSSSGGRTRKGQLPYLIPVESPEDSPHNLWSVEVDTGKFGKALDSYNLSVGDILDVHVEAKEENSRVVIIGSEKQISISPTKLRNILGIDVVKSPNFNVAVEGGTWELSEFRQIFHWMKLDAISAYEQKEVKIRNSVVTSGRLTRPMFRSYFVGIFKPFPEKLIITGRGYGHGLGMSQWGAKKMAENGYSWDQIIHHYYSRVQIKTITEVISALPES